ncbi:MAG: hypothetical protein U0325_29055 [Polyangiales bacterium]
MNALDMSVQTVRKSLLRLVPPPPPPRHPNLRELHRAVLAAVKSLEGVSQALCEFSPLSGYGDDGALLLPEESLRDTARLAEKLFLTINGRAWAPMQRAADKHFAALGPRLRAAVDDARWAVRNLALDIDLMVGTGFAERAGIDTGPVKPAPLPEPPAPPAPVSAEYLAAAEAEATRRATLDDGTVDPFLFAAELADLLPAVPGMPSNSDPWPGRANA